MVSLTWYVNNLFSLSLSLSLSLSVMHDMCVSQIVHLSGWGSFQRDLDHMLYVEGCTWAGLGDTGCRHWDTRLPTPGVAVSMGWGKSHVETTCDTLPITVVHIGCTSLRASQTQDIGEMPHGFIDIKSTKYINLTNYMLSYHYEQYLKNIWSQTLILVKQDQMSKSCLYTYNLVFLPHELTVWVIVNKCYIFLR